MRLLCFQILNLETIWAQIQPNLSSQVSLTMSTQGAHFLEMITMPGLNTSQTTWTKNTEIVTMDFLWSSKGMRLNGAWQQSTAMESSAASPQALIESSPRTATCSFEKTFIQAEGYTSIALAKRAVELLLILNKSSKIQSSNSNQMEPASAIRHACRWLMN